jgi:hypothetical protein
MIPGIITLISVMPAIAKGITTPQNEMNFSRPLLSLKPLLQAIKTREFKVICKKPNIKGELEFARLAKAKNKSAKSAVINLQALFLTLLFFSISFSFFLYVFKFKFLKAIINYTPKTLFCQIFMMPPLVFKLII